MIKKGVIKDVRGASLLTVPLALKMEIVCLSETLVFTYKSTRRYNPEE
jgi:hypothetical protein